MPIELKTSVGFTVSPELFAPEPSITRWQRLESDISELDITSSLEARIADPLWLVGRQWQFAELLGEDAGTPLTAQIIGEKVPLGFAAATSRSGEPLAGGAGLIEPVVEAERARGDNHALAAQAGLDFERALALHGVASVAEAFRERFPFELPEDVAKELEEEARDFTLLALGRAIDGAALATDLSGRVAPDGSVTDLPDGINAGSSKPAVLRAVREWLDAWRSLVFEPEGELLWRDSRLEYSFELECPHAVGTTALPAEEFHGGRLDWSSFDLGKTAPASAAGTPVDMKRLPLPIRYPGMPANRYWECEDGGVNFARSTGGPTTISLMLLLEYALVASNDWFHMPVDLDYGSGFRLTKLTVTDSFGITVEIGRATDALFELTPTNGAGSSPALFVLPHVTAHAIEGEPIEEAAMFRDEMANLVWGVERKTAGFFGTGIDRRTSAADGTVLSQQPQQLEDVDAATLYRLQSTVALNWYPFVARQDPAAEPGVVILSRRNLRRLVQRDGALIDDETGPAGSILKGESPEFHVEEQEVPRSGLIITRRMQHARTADGRRVVWVGREKRVGEGEGRSELRYDYLEPVQPPM
jgi:hypothetical protein